MANNPFFGIKVSKPGIGVQKATDKQLIYKDDFTSKVWYDNSNSRIVQGQLPDGSYGMWVSKPGADANNANAATNSDLIFNSNNDIFTILKTGTVTVSATYTSGLTTSSTTVTHNLGFTPAFFAYANYPTGGANSYWSVPLTVIGYSAGIYIDSMAQVLVDKTKAEFIVSQGSSVTNGNWAFRYYLIQETAN